VWCWCGVENKKCSEISLSLSLSQLFKFLANTAKAKLCGRAKRQLPDDHTGFLLLQVPRFALSFFCEFYERSQVDRVTACVQCVHSVRSTTRN